MIEENGMAEYFDPLIGKGLGGMNFSWTAAIYLDLCRDLLIVRDRVRLMASIELRGIDKSVRKYRSFEGIDLCISDHEFIVLVGLLENPHYFGL